MSSTYKSKKFSKKKTKPLAVKRDDPVYLYITECHNVEAVKPPCERSAADREKRQYGSATLGTWKCPVCRKKAKVRRRINKPEPVEEGVTSL